MKRYHGTIDFVGSRRAIITLTDNRGEWQGAQRLDLPRTKHGKRALYEMGYDAASVMAALKGGALDTFRTLEK